MIECKDLLIKFAENENRSTYRQMALGSSPL